MSVCIVSITRNEFLYLERCGRRLDRIPYTAISPYFCVEMQKL